MGLDTFLTEIEKLKRIRAIGLSTDLFQGISAKIIQKYRQRAATESPYDLRQHPEPIRYTLMSAFCHQRSQEITDNLIEILISIIKRIGTRAEKRIQKELIEDFKLVNGKTNILFRIAEVALANPQGVIQTVVYPVVSQETLKNLVKEYKSTNTAYRQKVHTVMRSSFATHYRRMIPQLLEVLEFRSNNDIHRPIILALELLKKYTDSKAKYYSGKKKTHTYKNQIICLPQGKDIIHVIAEEAGRISDINIFRNSLKDFAQNQTFIGDKAYVGESQIITPKKKPKNGELTEEEKINNREKSSQRIFVEHLIRIIKIFSVMRERFRLNKSRYESIVLTVCGLVRLRIGSLSINKIKYNTDQENYSFFLSHIFSPELNFDSITTTN